MLNRAVQKPVASAILATASGSKDLSQRMAALKQLPQCTGVEKHSESFTQFIDETLLMNPPVLDLLDLFSKINYSPGALKLLPRLHSFATSATPADLSLVAFLCGNLGLKDAALWTALHSNFRSKTPKHLARFYHGLSSVGLPLTDREKSEIASVLPRCRAVDLVMLNRACQGSEISEEISRSLVRLNEKLPGTAVVSLFEFLEKTNPEFLEYLAEQSRSLRLEPAFNDLGCVVVARKCAEISWKDPRVLFQIVHFVNTHTLRKECLLPTVEAFAKLRIPDEKPWRRFVARLEKLGPQLTSAEIRKFENCLRRAKQLDNRAHGVIHLLKDVRDDVDLYGAC